MKKMISIPGRKFVQCVAHCCVVPSTTPLSHIKANVLEFGERLHSVARAFAAEKEIPRIGQAYVWSRDDVEELLDVLDREDDSEEPDGDDADDDAGADHSDEDDEDE